MLKEIQIGHRTGRSSKLPPRREEDRSASPKPPPQTALGAPSPKPSEPLSQSSEDKEDKPAEKLSFKLGLGVGGVGAASAGAGAAKSKVSFQFKRNLRSSALPRNDEDEEDEEDDEGSKVVGGDEDKNIEKTSAGEYVPTRFKVSKKHEMFRPSQGGGPQSITVVFDSSSIGGSSALSFSQTSSIAVSNLVFKDSVPAPTGEIEQMSKPALPSDPQGNSTNSATGAEEESGESKKEDDSASKEEGKDNISSRQSRGGK
ncbi:hypothetical protein EGW08_007675, partial [Elysia chlorotica]